MKQSNHQQKYRRHKWKKRIEDSKNVDWKVLLSCEHLRHEPVLPTFADDILTHFLEWKVLYHIQILLRFVVEGLIDNNSTWVRVIVWRLHYNDAIMNAIASHITRPTIVYSTVYLGADQRKHQSSASLAFVMEIHRDRWIPRTKGQ